MKKLYIIVLTLFMFSCSDFLREEPSSERTVGSYFTDITHGESSVNMLYREGIWNLHQAASAYNGPKVMSGNYMSGFFDNPKYKGQENFIVEATSLSLNSQTSSGYLDDIWEHTYKAIGRANTAIKYVPEIPNISKSKEASLLAQAYFFRALNYFYLVRYFGDVPLILEPYENLKDMYAKRTPVKDVYAKITDDLEKAKKLMADEGDENLPMCKNKFRISQGSVNALLSDIYLTMSGFPANVNKYTEAAKAAREIINSNNYRLIQHINQTDKSAYNILRTTDVQDEYLYQIELEAAIRNADWMPVYAFPTGSATWPGKIFKYSITTEVYLPRDEFYGIYDTINDLRIKEHQFFHSSWTYSYTEKDATGNDVEKTETRTFPRMPFFYADENALFTTGTSGKDIIVYRYAEVLLIAAEAIAQTEGVTTDAVQYLTDVRKRAYTKKTEADIKAELQSLAKDKFIEEVWKERQREFPCEYKTWFDIQRTRKIMNPTAKSNGNFGFVNVIGGKTTFGKTFAEKDLLYPISFNELQRNPALVQNAGY